MRNLILAAALGAVGLTAAPADAQRYGNYGQYNRDYRHDVRDSRQDCRRAVRRADNRWEMRRAREICQRARYSHRGRGYDDHRRYR
jgi:hypothetical protein